MSRGSQLTAKAMAKVLFAMGYQEVHQKGSHRKFKHPQKIPHVTIPDHGSQPLKPGTLASICRQMGLTKDQLLRHLDTL